MNSNQSIFQDNLHQIILITNIISLITSLIMILFYFYFKSIQTLPYKLVLCLNIADVFLALGNLLISYCQLQAYLLNFGSLSSILWTSIIAYSLYQSVINQITQEQMNFTFYFWIGFLIPALYSLYPFYFGYYGHQQYQCWIADDIYEGEWIKMLNLYFPLTIVLTFNSIIYIKIIFHIYDILDDQKYIIKLITYPTILFICWVLPIFYKNQETWISYVSITFNGLVGLFNALGYGFTGELKKQLRCCRNKIQQQQQEQEYEQSNLELKQSSQNSSFIQDYY